MRNFLYFKLARSNLKKNRQIYFPYTLANILVVGMYYILKSIRSMMLKYETTQGSNSDMLLKFCTIVAVIMACIILFYVNSFVIQKRKKEIGLYCVLGMEKRHLSMMMLWEVLITALRGLIGGMIAGALLSQLVFLIFLSMLRIPSGLRFEIPLDAVGNTCLIFGILYLIVLIYNITTIVKTNPIEFLKGAKEGEKEPKVRKLPAILGVVLLVAGYTVAIGAQGVYETLKIFLPAVLLVIVSTYLLFFAGSIAFLKWMKKWERFYYRPRNFITISGMIYRMKQNAAGLATICILSTAVIVSISTSFSLYLGEEDILEKRFPRDYMSSCILDDQGENISALQESIQNHAEETGVKTTDGFGYKQLWMAGMREADGNFTLSNGEMEDASNIYIFAFLTQDDYSKNTGTKLDLKSGEAAIFQKTDEDKKSKISGNLTLDTLNWKIKRSIDDPGIWNEALYMANAGFVTVVLSDLEAMTKVRDIYNKRLEDTKAGIRVITYEYYYNIEGEDKDKETFFKTLRETMVEDVDRLLTVDNIDQARADYYEQYGTFLFIGIFLSILFLIAVSLIIYYKQITEGFDDRERYQIMKKVGMTNSEIRSTIRRQILQVFFLPLLMAATHTAAAFPALVDIMRALNLINKTIFIQCTIAVTLTFMAVYFIIYTITSRTYYLIVR